MSDFERLDLTGLNLVDTSVDYAGTILRADFGGGFKASAVVNLPCREWTLAADVLVDLEDEALMVDGGAYGPQTRLRYLYGFYKRHMDAGCQPFWVRDELDGCDYLAEFVDERMTLEVFTSVVYATGLALRQRRVSGAASAGGQSDVENPDQI